MHLRKKRRYTVQVSAREAARLRAFDNEAAGAPWPLGPNVAFRRGRGDTFHVKQWTNAGVGNGALVTTIGTAALRDDDAVDVVIKSAGHWPGYLLLVGGVVCLGVVGRDGLAAGLAGLAMLVAGWFLFLRRPRVEADLDEIEAVLRAAVHGTWVAAERLS